MLKRTITTLASLALLAGLLAAVPARAAEQAPTVPAAVQVEDPAEDANGVNNQGLLPAPAPEGDTPGGAYVGAADVLKAWFTNTPDTISSHILVNGVPPNSRFGLIYRVHVNPGDDASGCIWLQGVIPSISYTGEQKAEVRFVCEDKESVPGTLTIAPVNEESAVVTMTYPRTADAAFAAGGSLKAPSVTTRVIFGEAPENPSGRRTVTAPQLDNTKPGTDYAIVEGASGKVKKPKPVKPTTPVRNGCDNGQGVKNGCKKTPKPKSCKPITPATAGAEAPHVTVTDAHTAEKPLVHPITLDAAADEGLAEAIGVGETPSVAVNVTVDSLAKETGFYASLSFPDRRDYDLWAYYPGSENEEAASSHGFSPLIETQGAPSAGPVSLDQSNTASNHGGETTVNSENLVGIRTSDCGGYTVEVLNYLGEGGDFELKLFTGEIKNDPFTGEEGTARATSYLLATL